MENTEADIELRYLLRGSEPVVQLILEYDSKLIRLSRWRGFVIRAFTIYLNA